jgi:hypothetical protein
LHHLLLTGLPAHYINFRFVSCPHIAGGLKDGAAP